MIFYPLNILDNLLLFFNESGVDIYMSDFFNRYNLYNFYSSFKEIGQLYHFVFLSCNLCRLFFVGLS